MNLMTLVYGACLALTAKDPAMHSVCMSNYAMCVERMKGKQIDKVKKCLEKLNEEIRTKR
jgi:hypothetical protein